MQRRTPLTPLLILPSMRMDIPDEVRRFILTSVPSVPYLEAMLLLREQPGRDWNASTLATRLYLPPERVAALLQELAEAGFVTSSGSENWRWQPAPEAGMLVDQLASVYSENLLGVTELIHSREERRAHQFADAFRWRPRKEDK
jgi:DNA-binding MarR family transcriptional regulator